MYAYVSVSPDLLTSRVVIKNSLKSYRPLPSLPFPFLSRPHRPLFPYFVSTVSLSCFDLTVPLPCFVPTILFPCIVPKNLIPCSVSTVPFPCFVPLSPSLVLSPKPLSPVLSSQSSSPVPSPQTSPLLCFLYSFYELVFNLCDS